MTSNILSTITGRATENTSEDLAVSIQAHLTQLLNSRRGMTPHLSHYGLPDIHYVYYSLPHSLEKLAEEIRQTIVLYEPRLTNVSVTYLGSDSDVFRATYRIAGEVAEGSRVSKLTFETEVLRNGRAKTSLVTQYG